MLLRTQMALWCRPGTQTVSLKNSHLKNFGKIRHIFDFYVSPTKYTESEQRITAGTMYVDTLGRIVSAATPAPARQTYEAFRLVLDSLAKVVKELQSTKGTTQGQSQSKQEKKNNK